MTSWQRFRCHVDSACQEPFQTQNHVVTLISPKIQLKGEKQGYRGSARNLLPSSERPRAGGL